MAGVNQSGNARGDGRGEDEVFGSEGVVADEETEEIAEVGAEGDRSDGEVKEWCCRDGKGKERLARNIKSRAGNTYNRPSVREG